MKPTVYLGIILLAFAACRDRKITVKPETTTPAPSLEDTVLKLAPHLDKIARSEKISSADSGAYYLEVRNAELFPGTKSETKYLLLSLVFPTQPTVQQAQEAAIAEIQKHATQGLDINAVPKFGDKNDRLSQQQLRDPAGGLFLFRYVVADGMIYNKTTPIKKFP